MQKKITIKQAVILAQQGDEDAMIALLKKYQPLLAKAIGKSIAKGIEAEDLDTAFEVAHALKGIYANLSLTPLLTPTSEITELLRARTKTDYTALLAEIRAQRDKLAALSE